MNNHQQKKNKVIPLIWIVVLSITLSTIACRIGARVPPTPIPSPSATEDSIEELSQLATLTQQALEALFTDIPPSSTSTATSQPPTETQAPTTTPSPGPTSTPASASPDTSASRIRFFSGGTISMIERGIRSGQPHLYTFNALNGQTIIISVASPGSDVTFALERVDTGQDLVSPSAGFRDWTGTIPAAGAYYLSISTNNPDTDYFLTLEIPANIEFETGAISDTIDGHIEVFDEFHPDIITRVRYLAFAFAGQTMEIELDSPNLDGLSLGIVGQTNGQVYANYAVKSHKFELDLPVTQGYYIDVYAVNGVSTDFELEVIIK